MWKIAHIIADKATAALKVTKAQTKVARIVYRSGGCDRAALRIGVSGARCDPNSTSAWPEQTRARTMSTGSESLLLTHSMRRPRGAPPGLSDNFRRILIRSPGGICVVRVAQICRATEHRGSSSTVERLRVSASGSEAWTPRSIAFRTATRSRRRPSNQTKTLNESSD